MSTERSDLSKFIILCDFTRDGMAELLGKGADLKAKTDELAEEFPDVVITSLWLTDDKPQLVAVIEATANDRAVSYLTKLNPDADFTTTTLSVVGELDDVIKAASEAHTKMQGKG